VCLSPRRQSTEDVDALSPARKITPPPPLPPTPIFSPPSVVFAMPASGFSLSLRGVFFFPQAHCLVGACGRRSPFSSFSRVFRSLSFTSVVLVAVGRSHSFMTFFRHLLGTRVGSRSGSKSLPYVHPPCFSVRRPMNVLSPETGLCRRSHALCPAPDRDDSSPLSAASRRIFLFSSSRPMNPLMPPSSAARRSPQTLFLSRRRLCLSRTVFPVATSPRTPLFLSCRFYRIASFFFEKAGIVFFFDRVQKIVPFFRCLRRATRITPSPLSQWQM